MAAEPAVASKPKTESSRPWLTRFAFQRGLALCYSIAFVVTLNQFQALSGERGLEPVPLFVRDVPFFRAPSLFFFIPHDSAFSIAAWLGLALSLVALSGLSERYGSWFSMLVWGSLWAVYLSFVNVGQTFYGFGWESMLLEAGFYAIFAGAAATAPQPILMWILRWELFRVMFGAGLIKLRGDPCWRDLTCLNYHFETQPLPNGLSWYWHWMPAWVHQAGVLFNHFVELVVPFGYFAPQPVCAIAGMLTIVFQALLMLGGNLSFLNLVTMVLAFSTLEVGPAFLPASLKRLTGKNAGPTWHRYATLALAAVVGFLSIPPVLNMISQDQAMNLNYNPFHLVNTYGAFGSITRPRYEVVVEGTAQNAVTPSTIWREYEFKAKPGDPGRRPPQVAPYHLRLDWLMWFAAFSSPGEHPWFVHLMAKLLEGDQATLSLLPTNPFPNQPPHYVRALLYEYHFTTPEERRETGKWWKRQLVGEYFPPVSLDDPAFREILRAQGWL